MAWVKVSPAKGIPTSAGVKCSIVFPSSIKGSRSEVVPRLRWNIYPNVQKVMGVKRGDLVSFEYEPELMKLRIEKTAGSEKGFSLFPQSKAGEGGSILRGMCKLPALAETPIHMTRCDYEMDGPALIISLPASWWAASEIVDRSIPHSAPPAIVPAPLAPEEETASEPRVVVATKKLPVRPKTTVPPEPSKRPYAPPRLDVSVTEEVEDLLSAGMPARTIAEELGLDLSFVTPIALAHRTKRRA